MGCLFSKRENIPFEDGDIDIIPFNEKIPKDEFLCPNCHQLVPEVLSLHLDIKKIDFLFEDISEHRKPITQTLVSSTDYREMVKFFGTTEEKLDIVKEKLKEIENLKYGIEEIEIPDVGVITASVVNVGAEELYNERMKELEEEYALELNLIRNYSLLEQNTLSESFKRRYEEERDYFDKYQKSWEAHISERTELLYKQAEKEKEIADQSASDTYDTLKEDLSGKSQTLKDGMLAITNNV